LLLRSIVARMWVRSSLRAISLTIPITTFLYLTWVFLASRPSAVRKLTVIFGPTFIQSCSAMDKPIRPATIGTSQTSETRTRRRLTSGRTGAAGEGGRALSDIFNLCVPDKPGIETHGGEHRHHHNQTKKQNTDTRLDGAELSELHKRRHQGNDQYVKHRPVADQLDKTIEPRPLLHGPGTAALA